jgi:4-amino-4-deoxy-L-arabinose transferase-like glycosyltransferase
METTETNEAAGGKPQTPGSGWGLPLRTLRQEAAVVIAAVAVFIGISAFKALRQPYPYFDDVDFLDLGNRIRDAGGAGHLWGDLYAGRFTESNRHPLYLAILALFARPELAFHDDARVLAVALGALALLACWWTARRHFGREAAALLAVMLSGSGALVWTASRECADTMLVAFWALSIGGILDGARNGGADDGPNRRAFLLAGVWGGLAYLSKGPGIFLPICVALTLLARDRLRALQDLRGWLFGGAFALVSSPLWVRNLRVYHSPTYSLNSKYLWIDRLPDFAETFAPHADALLPHGPREYFARATPASLVWRVVIGLGETIFHFGDALALVAPGPGTVLHVAWVVLGVVLGGISVRLLWKRERGFARTFHLVHTVWWCLFLWFFNASGGASRYFLPLVTTTLLPVLAARLVEGGRLASRRFAAVAGLVTFSIAGTLALDREPTRAPDGWVEVETWLLGRLAPGESYAVDARTHLQPRWLAPRAHQVIISASWNMQPIPTDEMLRYLCEEHVRYVVLDARSETSAVEPGGSRSRYLFYDRVPLEPDGSLPLTGFPGGLRPVYVGAESPRRWMVLETACPPAALAAALP